MASIINATTSTGLVQTADNSGSLQLQTNNGTTAVTIDTSQNTTFVKPITIGSSILGSGNATSFKNRIINGAMVIDQRNAGASVTMTTNLFTLDRWAGILTQASKYSIQQNAGSVTPPAGFTNYLGVTSLSAYSVGSGDTFFVYQAIEGYNFADLNWGSANAKTVTLSFWVRSSLTGTFGGALTNNAADRSYAFTYTISSANTWEQKSITIPGDTSGTWLTNNLIGANVRLGLGSGSTFTKAAGSWGAGNIVQANGDTSVVGTNGATWYITGVQLEVGSTATSFDYRPYGTELQLCQRYCQVFKSTAAYYLYTTGFNEGTTASDGSVVLKTTMRTAPSATFTAGSTFRSYSNQGYTATNIGTISLTPEQVGVQLTVSGAPAGYGCTIQDAGSNNSSMTFSAEL